MKLPVLRVRPAPFSVFTAVNASAQPPCGKARVESHRNKHGERTEASSETSALDPRP